MVSTVSGSFFTRSHTNEASSNQSRIVRGIGLKAFVDGRQAQKTRYDGRVCRTANAGRGFAVATPIRRLLLLVNNTVRLGRETAMVSGYNDRARISLGCDRAGIPTDEDGAA